ncbi:nuclear transport factor 2 family protein [Streptacidiphilus sp. P02-A3a]|uniref:nuclear transport factor 2 family protein n=1 Tax=Streptacidiphilus sp. P02-A3a TaxID=2704468 RepID=UPI0015F82C9E|nr:nuclear transport factor 2 family protein [Streptacidiphilus sp. P02-A3a]QMU71598.1 nuclear transport factor 2 family protein [Streptacidiphilus sp. P02-A3a]
MTEATDQTTSRLELVERLRTAMETKDKHAFVDQFADDGVYELPFALDGAPSRWEGIDTIRALLTADSPMSKLLDIQRVSVQAQPGVTPDVVTVEFTVEGKNASTGEAFSFLSSIGVIRVRDGKIVYYRDYPSSLRGAQVAGMLKPYAESLAARS